MGSAGFSGAARLRSPAGVAAVEPGTARAHIPPEDLLARVNQAHPRGLRELGLRPGDGLAILAPNGVRRAGGLPHGACSPGWYLTPVNWHFTVPEIAYILRDSEAKVFFAHERFAAAGAGARGPRPASRASGGRISYGNRARIHPGGSASVTASRRACPDGRVGRAPRCTTPPAHHRPAQGCAPPAFRPGTPNEARGTLVAAAAASSASQPGPAERASDHPRRTITTAVSVFGGREPDDGPSALCTWTAGTPRRALALVEQHKVTNTHMVPTHFSRAACPP